MNRIYRLCWNAVTSQWVAASELARNSRPAARSASTSKNPHAASIALAIALALSAAGAAHAGQTGGQIVSGSGAIHQNGATTTINQGSQHLSLNWQTFDIAPNETVNFVQPGRDAIAVNRILGNSASGIYGHLNANGQVWLINPNGVLFGQGAQVNVGGLVASTLDTSDSSLSSDTRSFSGNGKGSVVNKGSIRAANGGYVALLGNTVSNQGTISAQLGTVAMGGGSAVTLTFDGSQLLHLQVDRSTLDNLVENRQLVQADGGRVLMTAGAADSLLASTVNNTGVVRAQTVENHNGQIVLLGGMQAGHVNVEGTLDASAPNGGNGGSIETSAAFAHIGAASINASAPKGKAGTWLVDPYDLTIDATAAATISTTLNGGTSVTEITTATDATGQGVQNASGVGDINVNSAITWNSAAATLTLDAYRGINVNAPISGAGGVVLTANRGNITLAAGGTIAGGAGVTLTAANNFINHAGSAALNSALGKWLVYSSDPTLDTRGGLAPQFMQYAANAGATPLGAGNGFLYKLAPTLTVTGLTGSVSKVYDSTNSANFTGANLTTTGLTDGDTIIGATGGTYATVNAASNIRVTSPGTIDNFSIRDAAGTIPVFGYALGGSPVSARVGQITPAPLTAQIIGNPTKTYDGTATATLGSGNYQIDGFVGGQSATVKQPSSIAYAGSDAGSVALNATFSVTNFTAGAGTSLANYLLPTAATGMGTINQAPLLISGLLASNKIYDGNANDAILTGGAKLFGVIQPDSGQVALVTTGIVGTFADANVANGIGVAISGYALTGGKASNYVLQAPTGLSANITPKTLTINPATVTANNKIYDNTKNGTLTIGDTGNALTGKVGSDDVTLTASGVTALFGQTDVGSGLAVTASGFGLTGSAAGNYMLAAPVLTADITPRLLTIGMIGNPTKTYDGTNAVTLNGGNFTLGGFVAGQSATVGQSSATYATANAGSGIDVTAALQPSDFVPAGGTSMSNYTFAPTVTGFGLGVINPLQLTGQIVGNPTKVFDGTTDAALSASNLQLLGLLSGQSIGASFSGTVPGQYDNPNAGARGASAGALPGTDFTAGSGTLLSNYLLPTSYLGSGSITPAPLTGGLITLGVGIVNASKIYDGSLNISLMPNNFTLSGWVGTDSGVVSHSIIGTFGQKNVGTDLALSAGLSTADLTPGGSTILSNYAINTPVLGIGNITPAQLTVSIVGNPTKTYNGSTNAALGSGNFNVSGWVSGESGTINPSATASYDSANASTANGRAITATLTPGNYVLGGSTLLSNYNVDLTATGSGTINQAPLFVTGVFATNRSYNATTADTLNLSRAGLAGLVDTDAGSASKVALNLAGVSANFSQANVGNGLTVTAAGFGITGSAAANYILQPVAGLIANITQATLTLSGVTANDKTYDGNTTATLTIAGNAALNGVFAGDTVGFDGGGASGRFGTANAGDNLGVAISGFGLNGGSSGNYELQQPAGLTATINPKQLTAVITGSPTKVYDGTDSATLIASDYDLQGFVGIQGASIPQSATANYLTKNVGTGLGVASTLVTSDFVANAGTDLSNYILPTTGAGSNGVIQSKVIDLTGTRVYDGTATANSSLFGVLQGVNGETLGVTGSGTLVDKNVGEEKDFFAMGSLALANGGSGGLASNYTLVGGVDWVTITPATLTVSGTVADDKIYDHTTAAHLSGSTLNGVFAGDAVTLANDALGQFSDKNVNAVGSPKTVTTSMTIDGGDIGNYVLVQPTGVTANITPKTIAPSATAQNRQYDGTTNAGTTLASSGVYGGDTVTFASTSSQFDGKDVANGRTVTVGGITVSGGADAGNYVLSTDTATTTANITPRIVNLSGTRVYDTTKAADAGSLVLGNVVAGESLSLGGSGLLSSKNVGTYKNSAGFGLDTLALSDAPGGLASNYTLVGGTDNYIVTKATLNVTGTVAEDKPYDGNTVAGLHGSTLGGVLTGDTVDLTNDATGTFDTKNVGTKKTVTTAMGIDGTDAGNYNLVQPSNLQADIAAKSITVVATGVNKVYDGSMTSAATLSGDIVVGDQVTFNFTTNTFDTKDVGTGKDVTVDGITSSGTDASNYILINGTAHTTAAITPFIINLSGTRTYDATAGAAAALFGTSGVVNGANGETLTLSGSGTTASKNVATYHRAADGTGNFDLNTLALTGNAGASAGNYSLVGGVDSFTITPFALTVDADGIDKVYNANTAAAVALSSLGIFHGDTIDFAAGTATFDNKNVGQNKPISIAGITASGADAGNYTWNATASAVANVTALAISGSILADDRVYDQTTGVVTHGSLIGVLAGDNLVYTSTTGSFGDKNVDSNKTVTVSGVVGGTDLNNYIVTSNTATTASITPATIVVTTTAPNKVYDGNTSASATLSAAGIITGDDVTFTGGPSDFSDANAATGKTVTTVGIAGAGLDARNYVWNTTATTFANITPYVISLHGSREYDGSATIAASVFASDSQVAGLNGDTLTLSGAGSVSDRNVGTAKTLTSLGTLGLQGNGTTLSSNYTLVGGTDDATITPKQIVVDATGSNKVYDGTTVAAAGLGSTGVVGLDQIVFTGADANYSDKNVANGKTITVDGITASGADAGNYQFNQTAFTTGNITPLGIAGNIIAGSKTYDGTTTAQTSGTLAGVLAGDQLGVSTSGNFADKNAGNGKTVNVAGVLTGADAGNYTLTTNATTAADVYKVVLNLDGTRVYDASTVASAGMFGSAGVIAGVAGESLILSGQGVLASKIVATDRPLAGLGSLALNDDGAGLAANYTLVGGNHIATVTPLGINAGISADDKVYDGNTGAITHGVLTGVLGGDQVTLATNGTFVDKNAANGKTVNVDGTIAGGDAGNYTLTFNPTTTASITKRPVVVDAQGIDKFFDGNASDRATLSSSGILPGDVIAFGAASALFGDPAVGRAKPVSVTGIYAMGADAGNYAFNASAETTASINQSASQGASAIVLAQIDGVLGPDLIATPYGAASNVTVGPFSGNHKKTRQPIEKNVQRADFVPGLSLQVVDGGVRLPADAMQ
ncbi:filamentous hemagglutinin family protein [Luteibacter sp. OK325]|uniref:YDG domain-containing protein n=1 Tax=Luteibacter sp. OK325 TaxID=2135670 RepID=UPI000D447984|nr:YDG domain-containing protein [Luteibacter sp. OK325]PTR32557.1 filamentous hemagglutinin family protein [Luteibacter sp. OK325]